MKIYIQHENGGIKYWLVGSGEKFSLDTDKKKALDVSAIDAARVAKKLAAVVAEHAKLDGFSVYGEKDAKKKKLKDNPRKKSKRAATRAKPKAAKASKKKSAKQQKALKPSPAKKPRKSRNTQ